MSGDGDGPPEGGGEMSGERRGRGFAAFEYGFVKENVPEFEWILHVTPSRRNPLSVDLSEARVALVPTAGAYVKPHPRFNKFPESLIGDTSFRVIEGIPEQMRFSHGAINTKLVYADPGVAVPVEMLHTLADEGVIGERRDLQKAPTKKFTGRRLMVTGPLE